MKQTNVLEGSRNAVMVDFHGFMAGDVFSVQTDDPFIRRVNAGQEVEDRCFSGAVRADQAMQLSLFNTDMEIIYGAQATERDAEIIDFKQCHLYASFFSALFAGWNFAASFSRFSIAAGAQFTIMTTMSTIE